MSKIHPTALVDPKAELASNVRVGPYAVIEQDTFLGEDVELAPFTSIRRFTRLAPRCRVYEHAVIGGEPQDFKFKDCQSFVEIGEGTVIREGVTIHRGSTPDAVTRIGKGCMLMAYSHVAHDCRIGDRVVLANGALLAGFVSVDEAAFVSGAVTVHQFCRIGRLAMVSQGARVTMDCLPFLITEGVPARARAVNVVGLKRAGYSESEIRTLQRGFKLLRSGTSLEDTLARLAEIESAATTELVAFIRASKRGFTHAR